MAHKIAGIINVIPVAALTSVWLILMLVAQPDCLSTLESAIDTAHFVLTQPDNFYFIASLCSIIICSICGVLIFTKFHHIKAMYIVSAHALVGIYIYDWMLALAIASPLLYFRKIQDNA